MSQTQNVPDSKCPRLKMSQTQNVPDMKYIVPMLRLLQQYRPKCTNCQQQHALFNQQLIKKPAPDQLWLGGGGLSIMLDHTVERLFL
jgi:hypothetical protein